VFLFSARRCCPNCHSRIIHRSTRRSALEKWVLPFILVRPFRCEMCDYRYFGFAFATRMRDAIVEENLQEHSAKL